MADIVLVQDLVKVYPGGTRAVDGIDVTVGQGEFFGFLGPNGAGKSTTLKILSTLLKKTSGRVQVAGYDVDRDPKGIRQHIGFAMQEVGLDDLATGRDFLVLQGLLYGLPRAESRRHADELLELVGLTSAAGQRVGTYSGGMRRRIDLVAALIHNPPVLFLDEPTTGLDPQSRLAIWDYLLELNRGGVTIFLTTQMMEEADILCQRIAIIDTGRIVVEGTPQTLKQGVGGDTLLIRIGEPADRASNVPRAQALLGGLDYVSEVTAVDSAIHVTVQDGSSAAPDVLRLLHDHEIDVTNLSVTRPSLDDVFLKFTGRSIRAEEASGDEMGQLWRPWLGLNRR